jgi:hypothetical protein
MKRVFGGLFLVSMALSLAAGCAVEKSENPLTPTIAGPLPGVGISAPSTVDPAEGTKIPVTSQPISLTVVNATTNGVRPLTYLFEVANDVNFASLVFQHDNVAPGDGRTTWRLPDSLPTGRTYYWRARAYDGANTGGYSNPTLFNVFTPVVIDKPIPISPVGNATIDTLQPQFRVANAARTGPAGPISYEVQVADNAGFANVFADWAFPETPSTSALTSPVSLANNKQYFWRIRAYETTVVGPWSDTQGFKTPAPAPVPTPTPTPTPPGNATCTSRLPADVVACHRGLYPALLSPADAPNLLRSIAIDLNRDRPGYYGRLVKTSGNNCGGFACDIICAVDTHIWDVFSDGPDASVNYSGTAGPQWVDKGTASPCQVP